MLLRARPFTDRNAICLPSHCPHFLPVAVPRLLSDQCARAEKKGAFNNGLFQELFAAIVGGDALTDGVVGAAWAARS